MHSPLSRSNLNGTLPSSIGAWTNMTHFSVWGNTISGSIPATVTAWTSISYFSVASDGGSMALTGPIPAGIGNAWKSINAFEVDGNCLTGPLPPSLSAWTKVTYFSVQGNLLNGTVPALPFEKMAPYNENSRACILSYSGDKARSNAFTCPLPAGALEHCIAVDAKDISAGSVPTDACNCTGNSMQLPAAQCNAWVAFYDATSGTTWGACSSLRTDPCSCNAGDGTSVCNAAGTAVIRM